MQQYTAEEFIAALDAHFREAELAKLAKFFRGEDGRTKALGVRFGDVFKTAKAYADMPLDEIERLLESVFYEIRMGAVSIMDFRAQRKSLTEAQRKALYGLYLRRHDRINNWDLVDRAAKRVVGGYLYRQDDPFGPLERLAGSEDVWERRTAIVATSFFIAKGAPEATFRIAALLVRDGQYLIRKAVGGWVREAGKKDLEGLLAFLDRHAADMPRTMLRYAVGKLDKAVQERYLT